MARRDSGGFDFDAMDEDTAAPDSEVAATDAAPEGEVPEGDNELSAEIADIEAAADSAAADGDGGVLPEAEGQGASDEKKRPITLYRHWVRPKFLQYRYMYDYRTNYYNDVIEYLDKRAKGEKAEIPRAQTWAERVLRTHTNPTVLDYYTKQKKEDKHLIQTIAASIKTHNYHTKAYINQRYASVL